MKNPTTPSLTAQELKFIIKKSTREGFVPFRKGQTVSPWDTNEHKHAHTNPPRSSDLAFGSSVTITTDLTASPLTSLPQPTVRASVRVSASVRLWKQLQVLLDDSTL